MWQQAKQRADEIGSMVLWCDGGEGGVSGIAGRGRTEVTQVGDGSWVRTIGVQWPFEEHRTMYARYGDVFALLFFCVLVLGGSTGGYHLVIQEVQRVFHGWRDGRRVAHRRELENGEQEDLIQY